MLVVTDCFTLHGVIENSGKLYLDITIHVFNGSLYEVIVGRVQGYVSGALLPSTVMNFPEQVHDENSTEFRIPRGEEGQFHLRIFVPEVIRDQLDEEAKQKVIHSVHLHGLSVPVRANVPNAVSTQFKVAPSQNRIMV